MKTRISGILLHITSLPGGYGTGDLGPEAYRFADFLHRAGQHAWQILPLNPTDRRFGMSPYTCLSVFAGNPHLLSPRRLYEDGWIRRADLANAGGFSEGRADFAGAIRFRARFRPRIMEAFDEGKDRQAYHHFCRQNRLWLEDYALFAAYSRYFKTPDWSAWPRTVRDRSPEALNKPPEAVQIDAEYEKRLQYLFFTQWFALKDYANHLGIRILGDLPIYAAWQSADVWANRHFFKLDRSGKPAVVSGVPPDLFSRTGQLWGMPVYDWKVLKEQGYAWWVERMRQAFRLYDWVRVDHFRGLIRYWQVPAGHKTAARGRWEDGPGEELLKTIYQSIPSAQIIAEDLGYITPDVREAAGQFEIPGMKVLLFAFENTAGDNPYLPHHHPENCVVYTGTHDNNTVRGWFEKEATAEQKKALFAYLGRRVSSREVCQEMIRLAMASVARTVIVPMQDVLGLGAEARMNRPAWKRGNWTWRLKKGQVTHRLADRLAEMTRLYGRM